MIYQSEFGIGGKERKFTGKRLLMCPELHLVWLVWIINQCECVSHYESELILRANHSQIEIRAYLLVLSLWKEIAHVYLGRSKGRPESRVGQHSPALLDELRVTWVLVVVSLQHHSASPLKQIAQIRGNTFFTFCYRATGMIGGKNIPIHFTNPGLCWTNKKKNVLQLRVV